MDTIPYLHNIMMINKLFVFLLLTLVSSLAYTQEPLDSTFWDAEMEDSISAMAIMPIKKPKELLDSILARLLYDMEQKPIARKYQVENAFVVGSTPSFKVKYILLAESGISMKIITGENFSYERLSENANDTSLIKEAIPIYSGFFPSYVNAITHNMNLSNSTKIPRSMVLRNLIHQYYDMKVYSISDESGRGVYRIDYSPKRKRITLENRIYYYELFTGTAYFDMHTLQLTQEKGIMLYDMQPFKRMFEKRIYAGDSSFSYSSPTSPTWTLVRYQVDYETNASAPIINQIRFERNIGGHVTKGTVQKIPE